MWALIRFGFGILALVSLFAIWTPVILRGFWPYTENLTQLEKLNTQRAESKGLIWTAYWLFASVNILAASYILQAPLTTRATFFWVLIDVLALILIVSFHTTQSNRNKTSTRASANMPDLSRAL